MYLMPGILWAVAAGKGKGNKEMFPTESMSDFFLINTFNWCNTGTAGQVGSRRWMGGQVRDLKTHRYIHPYTYMHSWGYEKSSLFGGHRP